MSKLGTYRNKNVYDCDSLTSAINASKDNDIFSVYWITGNWGQVFWKGEKIAHVHSDREGLHIVDFDEEVWRPKKKKEAPVPLPCVKEVKVTTSATVGTEELYDRDWYSKVMGELEKQWLKIRSN